jgi:hypothetical protein
MELETKILIAVLSAAVLVWLVIIFDRKIVSWTDVRLQLLTRSLLYALAFTPTVYHHAPNTIVAPLHLSTICGIMFYNYEYTAEMFLYGVALPVACSWVLISIVMIFRKLTS